MILEVLGLGKLISYENMIYLVHTFESYEAVLIITTRCLNKKD